VAEKLNKNAAKGKTDTFYCQCGGTVRMVSVFAKGKMRHEARCKQCNKVARFPGELA
jgi:predicted SprT family Zn-dependent metalloprotease